MLEQYIEFDGKHIKAKKENRRYSDEINPNWISYGCSYHNYILKLDIDDYDRKTGTLEEAIHGRPRSEAIMKLLDDLGIKYNAIRTEHGVQLFFRVPAQMVKKTIPPWYSVIGIKCEWKFPDSDDHIPLKVNGVGRIFIKGTLHNDDVDELPFFLYPLQKAKERPYDITFPSGARTQELGGYLFHLVKIEMKGLHITPEQAFDIVRYMNNYVFDEPIPENSLKAEILNDSTLEKLKANQKEKADKNLNHVSIGDEIIDRYDLITVNGDFYSYENGVYKPFADGKITAFMSDNYPAAKISLKREVIDYIKGKTYREQPQDSGKINVKNGILSIDDSGAVELLPHSAENISFKQFNAIYNPDVKCDLLEESLFKWFSSDSEEIELFKQMIGYLMMNHVDYEKIFFFIGLPSTGKTCLLKLIIHFCGKENVSSISLSDMNENFGLEPIINKTVNIFGDIPKTKMLKTDKFKMLADGSPMNIKRKYKGVLTYSFTGKLIFGMNQFPDMSNDFAGVERRLVIFRFNHVFKKGDADFNPHINSDLATDECMSALLNMAIDGYKSLIANKGFIATKKSERALDEFVTENDTVIQWLHESEITEDYLLREPIKNGFHGTYPEYQAFCITIGEEAKRQRDFSAIICNRYGFETKTRRLNGARLQMFVKK